MIALTDSEKHSLRAAFPEYCLKATPDPEFLLNLYDFDMSMCPHRVWVKITSVITEFFMELFDSINSKSRVPELLVWMQGQVRRIIAIFFTFIDISIETS